jgi:hypothetical protein
VLPKCKTQIRSQYRSHMMFNLGEFFVPLGQGDGCAYLDWMDLEKI